MTFRHVLPSSPYIFALPLATAIGLFTLASIAKGWADECDKKLGEIFGTALGIDLTEGLIHGDPQEGDDIDDAF